MTEDEPPLKKQAAGAGVVRQIAACQRCRLKKVKCDHNFPKCTRCAKAGLACVGMDPATGREVPRSYVFHLEERVAQLEQRLKANGIGTDDDGSIGALSAVQTPILRLSAATLESTLPHETATDSKQAFLGGSSGISFARLMLTAVRVHGALEPMRQDPSELMTAPCDPEIAPAALPPKHEAMELVNVYFAQSNAQLPVLHRETFLHKVFEPVYGAWEPGSHLAPEHIDTRPDGDAALALFFLHIIFAILALATHLRRRALLCVLYRKAALQYQDLVYGVGDPLQQLEALLLLSVYAIMRPSVPGVWYVLGTALRVCVDLGLHNDGFARLQERLPFARDRRRRLFWCTYLLDRQICFYLGRPVGIPDELVLTRFPTNMDDHEISPSDQADCGLVLSEGDYVDAAPGTHPHKAVALAFFQMRRIQLEVQRVLYENADFGREFASLGQWRLLILQRLDLWRLELPSTSASGFHHEYFTLNLCHTKLALYGLSPRSTRLLAEDYFRVAELAQSLMACYTQLSRKGAINYTWAAVHNLFMAGSSFLFCLYNSSGLRMRHSAQNVASITADGVAVLHELEASCDAAQACAHTFSVLSAAVLKLRYGVQAPEVPEPASLHPPRAVKLLLDGTSKDHHLASLVESMARDGGDEPTTNASEMEAFFLELENVLPISSGVDLGDERPKENQRVFELIQMPIESIWEQFFTNGVFE